MHQQQDAHPLPLILEDFQEMHQGNKWYVHEGRQIIFFFYQNLLYWHYEKVPEILE